MRMRGLWLYGADGPQMAGAGRAPLCPVSEHGAMRHDPLDDPDAEDV